MNKLSQEKSLYLLQHASNPVDWHAWNEETLKKARDERKLILVSIGYSSCHWCHVMEKESFTDNEVARTMNQFFICVKVDREERPDVDAFYMDAIQRITGQGGWPLNVFTLPDGRPFYGGTYFSKLDWITLMDSIVNLYGSDPQKVEDYATQLLENENLKQKNTKSSNDETQKILGEAYSNIFGYCDQTFGGIGRAPKFPMVPLHLFIQKYAQKQEIKSGIDYIKTTAGKMMAGGMFDVVGGGFARYSTDKEWRVPHFEKMLYDNAQLLTFYAGCSDVFPHATYALDKIMFFIEHEMKDEHGGYYSSVDADSEAGEGDFYVWTKSELTELLGTELSNEFCRHFNVTDEGNWVRNKNILHTSEFTPFSRENEVFPLMQVARAKRENPATDKKIITSWNALLAEGMISAGLKTQKQEYIDAGVDLLHFLVKHRVSENGEVIRITYDDKSVKGMPEDYAFLAHSLLSGYSITGEVEFLAKAEMITESCIKKFSIAGSSLFGGSDYKELQFKTEPEVHDLVTPSANSVLCEVFLELGMINGDSAMIENGRKMLLEIMPEMQKVPANFGNWLRVCMRLSRLLKLEMPAKMDSSDILSLKAKYPELIISHNSHTGSFTLCTDTACFLTVDDSKKLREAIHAFYLG